MLFTHLLMVARLRHEAGLEDHLPVREEVRARLSVEQPIPGDELRAVKRYLRQRDSKLPWLFLSEHGQPLSALLREPGSVSEG